MYRKRLEQNSTKFSTDNFLNIAILLHFPTSQRLLKKSIGMLQVTASIYSFTPISSSPNTLSLFIDGSLWPLGRRLLLSNVITSWRRYLVKVLRIRLPAMIFSGYHIPVKFQLHYNQCDSHLLLLGTNVRHFLVWQCRMMNGTTQNRESSSLSAFLRHGQLENSVRDPIDIAFEFGRRWAICSTHLKSTSMFTSCARLSSNSGCTQYYYTICHHKMDGFSNDYLSLSVMCPTWTCFLFSLGRFVVSIARVPSSFGFVMCCN